MNDDVILDDMWGWEHCDGGAYRTGRHEVSAWLNNMWYGLVARFGIRGNMAPWTWDSRMTGRFA